MSDEWETHNPLKLRFSTPHAHVTPPKDEINERGLILKQIRILEKLIDKAMDADLLGKMREISHASHTICKLLDRLKGR